MSAGEKESEFALIDRLFGHPCRANHPFTRLGIGDDCSIHQVASGMALAVSSDASVQGIHWPEDMALEVAADRAVCAALSDLAAMGAEPLSIWLNLMAASSEDVAAMAGGAKRACDRYGVDLAGGDTCRSLCNAASVTVAGQMPDGTAMRRDRARESDTIWLAGRVGLSALGLQRWLAGTRDGDAVAAFASVKPLLNEGVLLRKAGIRCCIDVSDGLAQDAGHLAAASGIGMEIELTSLPGWDLLCAEAGETDAIRLMAAGGEDYALLFTAAEGIVVPDIGAVCIGRCRPGSGVTLLLDGKEVDISASGFDHFG